MSDFRAVLFDLDGTLLDTVPDSRAALNRVLTADGLRPLSLDEVRTTVGEGARAMLERALSLVGGDPRRGDLDALIRRYMAAYLEDPCGHTHVYPGAVEVLDRLRRVGVRLAICTNKPKASTGAVLAGLRLDGYFDAVLCPEDVAHRKPDGRHLRAALSAIAVGHDDAVYVGDSETDIAAAADASVRSVLVTWGYCHVPVASLAADAVIADFAELPDALARIAAARSIA